MTTTRIDIDHETTVTLHTETGTVPRDWSVSCAWGEPTTEHLKLTVARQIKRHAQRLLELQQVAEMLIRNPEPRPTGLRYPQGMCGAWVAPMRVCNLAPGHSEPHEAKPAPYMGAAFCRLCEAQAHHLILGVPYCDQHYREEAGKQ